ncbi:MAG: hypothetical protein ACJA1C_001934 [Crocinitomicaceae bacterium]|jgi:hypothetical protein
MKTFNLSLTIALFFFSDQYLIGQKLPDIIPFKEKDLYGFCDSNLNVVIKAQYQWVYPFFEDRAIAVKDNLKGFIDRNGNQILPCAYKYASPFSDGYALVGTSKETAKYIDAKGQIVVNPNTRTPDPVPIDFGQRKNRFGQIKEGRYFYRGNNNTQGYMTVDGDTISSSEFTYPYYSESYSTPDDYDQKFQHFFESRAIVSGMNGQGYIDLNGDLIIDTLYEVGFNFKEGRAKVKLNGKYGFIDKQGHIIGEIKYDQACYFYDGMAQVIINDKCGYINLEGQEIIPLIYDYWQGEHYSIFKNGFVRVRINEKFGILDRSGNLITDVKFDDILPFYNEHAIVILKDKMGLIDEDGNEIIPPIYNRLFRLDQFAFMFEMEPNKREFGIINISGNVISPLGKGRPSQENGFGPGLYKVRTDTHGIYFIDKYGTEYLK